MHEWRCHESPAGPAVTVSLQQQRVCDLIHTDTTWKRDTFITRTVAVRVCAFIFKVNGRILKAVHSDTRRKASP